MKKRQWMMTAIRPLALTMVFCGLMGTFSACSNDDNPSVEKVTKPGTATRSYDLAPKVVSQRSIVGLQNLAGGLMATDVKQIIVEYTSVGPDMKTPVRLTGSISMNPDVYNKTSSPRSVVVYNEFTNTKHRERASQDEYDELSFYCNEMQDHIVLAADLYGWTLTENKPQTYCCTEIIGIETLDFYDAAMKVLDELGYPQQGLPRFNVGYSGGGFSAMAVQKFVDENRPDIEFAVTAAGAAPFNITSVYKQVVNAGVSGYPCAMPLIVVSFNETFNLNLDYKDIFAQPLANNVDKWILSKDYNSWEINELIAGDKETAGNCEMSKILTPQAKDFNSDISKKMVKVFQQNSLCGDGINWQPSKKTQFFILHSAGDTYMDWHVGKEMADYLKAKGCQVDSDFNDYGGHVEYGGLVFTIYALLGFEAVIDPEGTAVKNWLNGLFEDLDEEDMDDIFD